MGREWYWGGNKSSKRSEREKDNSVSAASGCMCAVFQLFDFHHFHFSTLHQHQQQPSIVQSNSNLLLHEDPPLPKGVEAPRNSLELEESQETSSFMSSSREDESLNIPMGIQIKTNIGDNTTRSKAHGATTYAPSDCSSEISSSSPGAKTPNLVARLMGLDLLPESNNISSPSTSTLNTPNLQHGKSYLHHFKHKNHLQQSNKPVPRRNSVDGSFTGTRSLPETPRISSARRSDVDLHHRLSLQINKENMSPAEELVLARISSLRRLKEVRSTSEDNESRSPSHYARQIVKQVKESVVGRKIGKDITNTMRRRAENASKEELVSRFNSKKLSKMGLTNNVVANVEDLCSPGKQSTTCSPRLKFLEIKNKENYNNKNYNVVSHPPKASLSTSSHGNNVAQNDKLGSNKPNLPPLQVQRQQQQEDQQRPVKKCKKVKEEKFGTVPQSKLKKPPQTSDIIRNKQEEPFVIRPTLTSNIPDKKCKKTPLSNHLFNNITSVPTLLPVKKDPTPPATKIPQKQVPSLAQESKRGCSQLSSCSSQSYNQEAPRVLDTRGFVSNNNDNNNNNNNNAELNGGCCSIGDDGGEANEEYEYVTRILRRIGIDNDTNVSFTRWFSPSHPLDPSIFHHLEYFISLNQQQYYVSGQLSHKCNRKLIFHLVDEILVEILKPYINLKPWSRQHIFGHREMFKGSHLVSTLCTKIKSYPRTDCRVLEDIDGIIDRDLAQMKVQSDLAFEEEADWIVTEIEKDILDTIVHETVLTF